MEDILLKVLFMRESIELDPSIFANRRKYYVYEFRDGVLKYNRFFKKWYVRANDKSYRIYSETFGFKNRANMLGKKVIVVFVVDDEELDEEERLHENFPVPVSLFDVEDWELFSFINDLWLRICLTTEYCLCTRDEKRMIKKYLS